MFLLISTCPSCWKTPEPYAKAISIPSIGKLVTILSKWHQQNMKLYPKHYSFLRYFGAKRVAKIQNNYGAGVYFNTLVHHEDRLIKYGVISTDRLITDFDTLFLSSPNCILKSPAYDKLVICA
jgi:hypothetical protein